VIEHEQPAVSVDACSASRSWPSSAIVECIGPALDDTAPIASHVRQLNTLSEMRTSEHDT